MAWLFLATAGVLEVVWAIALKKSDGFANGTATTVFVVAGIASMVLLAQALKSLPVGTAYAVWTGIGAVGAALVGIVWLGESTDAFRVLSIGLVAAGIVGLSLAST
ncbi:MAG: multidrug efflux SMR transporter [Thermoleophilaceae bacterium]